MLACMCSRQPLGRCSAPTARNGWILASPTDLPSPHRYHVVYVCCCRYVEVAAQLELRLGLACSELHVSPVGLTYTAVSGFASRYSLLRGLLGKLGLQPEVTQM
jgi:hypothetical protein